jgi:hypothetical protein
MKIVQILFKVLDRIFKIHMIYKTKLVLAGRVRLFLRF